MRETRQGWVPVRIRIEGGGAAAYLCDWPVDRLPELVAILGDNGLCDYDLGTGVNYSASVQFVVRGNATYYEIILG